MSDERRTNLFSGERSHSYKKAIEGFAGVWKQDKQIMLDYLSPSPKDRVLEIGAGSGFFSFPIAEKIESTGVLHATEPSSDLLSTIEASNCENIKTYCLEAEEVDSYIGQGSVNKIWSRGAFHHVRDKTKAMSAMRNTISSGGDLCLFDIFIEDATASFFDDFVAKSCTTGHEVSFLGREFARSLCYLCGWQAPRFHALDVWWAFENDDSLGCFLLTLLSAKESYSRTDAVNAAYKHLAVKRSGDTTFLWWPMTLMRTTPA